MTRSYWAGHSRRLLDVISESNLWVVLDSNQATIVMSRMYAASCETICWSEEVWVVVHLFSARYEFGENSICCILLEIKMSETLLKGDYLCFIHTHLLTQTTGSMNYSSYSTVYSIPFFLLYSCPWRGRQKQKGWFTQIIQKTFSVWYLSTSTDYSHRF